MSLLAEPNDRVENTIPIDQVVALLNKIGTTDLKIQRYILLQPLYVNTALERKPVPKSQNEDTIIRKNVYFLARKIKDPTALAHQLLQHGVLSFEERDGIMKHSNNILRAIEIFLAVIKQESSKFGKLLTALRMTDNRDVAGSLEDYMLAEAVGGTNAASTSTSEITVNEIEVSPKSLEPWNCATCTYRNSFGSVCEICNKSKDYTVTAENSSLYCSHCTFINPPGVINCDMCGETL